MWTVVAALLPAAAVGVFYFGAPALAVLATASAAALVFEAISRRFPGRGALAGDGGAVLTGLLLGMSLPPAAPTWVILGGCAAATFLGRLLAACLGFNPLNRALLGYAVLLLAFPSAISTWSPPGGFFRAAPDAVTAATPLAEAKAELLAKGSASTAATLDLLDGFVGRRPGACGETSVLALALGGLLLLWRGAVGWQIPVSFLGSVAALAAAFSASFPERFPGAGFHLMTGGLVLGAIFFATDPPTSPHTPKGRLLYGAGCGLLTWLIRTFGSFPEGVAFAILLMNLLTPAIDLFTRPDRTRG